MLQNDSYLQPNTIQVPNYKISSTLLVYIVSLSLLRNKNDKGKLEKLTFNMQ